MPGQGLFSLVCPVCAVPLEIEAAAARCPLCNGRFLARLGHLIPLGAGEVAGASQVPRVGSP